VCDTLMTSGLVIVANRKAKSSSIWIQTEKQSTTSSGCSELNVLPFHQHGLTSGSVRQQTVIFRRRVATRVAASNTDITSAGAKCAMKTSSSGSVNLPKRCRIFAGELLGT